LDYRDLWFDNTYLNLKFSDAKEQDEAMLLAMCSAVTIVSPSCAILLDQKYRLGEKLHVVTNGYDPEDMQQVAPFEFGHFAIVYAGTFFPPKRSISSVMAALKRIKDTHSDSSGQWKFHYYGRSVEHVQQEARRYGVDDHVIVHGYVTRSVALSALKGADISVVITIVDEDGTLAEKGIVTGKLFESLCLGKRVLLVAPPGSDAETIGKSSGLVHRFGGRDIDGMAAFLKNAMFNCIPSECQKEGALDPYAWPNIAKNFDSILRAVIEKESKAKHLRSAL